MRWVVCYPKQVWYSNPALRDWLKEHANASELDKLKWDYFLINKSPWWLSLNCLCFNFSTRDWCFIFTFVGRHWMKMNHSWPRRIQLWSCFLKQRNLLLAGRVLNIEQLFLWLNHPVPIFILLIWIKWYTQSQCLMFVFQIFNMFP